MVESLATDEIRAKWESLSIKPTHPELLSVGDYIILRGRPCKVTVSNENFWTEFLDHQAECENGWERWP